MAYKSVEDRRAYDRRYYQANIEKKREQARASYARRKQSPEFRQKLRDYQRVYRLKKQYGL